jgi:hypothetical protein
MGWEAPQTLTEASQAIQRTDLRLFVQPAICVETRGKPYHFAQAVKRI